MKRLIYTTIVGPDEYDIEEQMDGVIESSNQSKDPWPRIGAGKVIGLYLDWKRLKESSHRPTEGEEADALQ